VLALIASLAALAAPLPAQRALLPPSLEIRTPKPPTIGQGDGTRFLVYELHVTNLAPDTVILKRIEVLGDTGSSPFATLADSSLIAVLSRPGVMLRAPERAKIGGGLRAVVFMWVPLTEGAAAPRTLHHRLTFERTGADSGAVAIVDAPAVPVVNDVVSIAPPLRGSVWLAVNGPSPSTGHRRAMVVVESAPHIAQRFAFDYLKINDQGKSYVGDSLKNSSYLAYGQDALAVGDGVVHVVKDGIPENIPGSRAVPITLETVGGNHVIIDLGRGHYAFYAHLQPGSIRVKTGDRVKRGQVLGLVGNSGNSTEPHLHFHISDGTSPLGAEGIPYVQESVEVIGACRRVMAECTQLPTAKRVREMPMANQLLRFP
jgi:hypothetical protein